MNDLYVELVFPASLLALALVVVAVLLIGGWVDRRRNEKREHEALREGVARINAALERGDLAVAKLLMAHLILVARFGYNSGKARNFREAHDDQRALLCLEEE